MILKTAKFSPPAVISLSLYIYNIIRSVIIMYDTFRYHCSSSIYIQSKLTQLISCSGSSRSDSKNVSLDTRGGAGGCSTIIVISLYNNYQTQCYKSGSVIIFWPPKAVENLYSVFWHFLKQMIWPKSCWLKLLVDQPTILLVRIVEKLLVKVVGCEPTILLVESCWLGFWKKSLVRIPPLSEFLPCFATFWSKIPPCFATPNNKGGILTRNPSD